MKSSGKVLWGIAIAVVVVFAVVLMSNRGPAEPGKYNDFANCLSESGAKMYGAYNCPHCADQKKSFGDAADLIPYIECHPNGNNARPELCDEMNIEGYPTWIFGNGEKTVGVTPFSELAFRSDCKLPV